MALCKLHALDKLHNLYKLDMKQITHWLNLDKSDLTDHQSTKLNSAINASPALHTIYHLHQDLAAIWERSTATKEQLLKQLNDWCHRAENSGILAVQEFSQRLRCYA